MIHHQVCEIYFSFEASSLLKKPVKFKEEITYFPRSNSAFFSFDWMYLPITILVKQELQTDENLVNLICGMLSLYITWENWKGLIT